MLAEDASRSGFAAEYSVWNFGALSLTRVSAPATRTVRTSAHIRRSPIDHWVISYCRNGSTVVSTSYSQLDARAGVPFVWSLGQVSDSRRTVSDRLQLYLPRDAFSDIGPSLDMAVGSMLDTGLGQLLADYMLLLERNLPKTHPRKTRLAFRMQFGAWWQPAWFPPPIDWHVLCLRSNSRCWRRYVRRSPDLRSSSLGPRKLCRETAMSRSQLYRLLESEGGVASYIQRRRLSESFSMLCDTSSTLPISEIAASLCFSDPSSFSRAFRREFGGTPTDARASSRSGRPPAKQRQQSGSHQSRMFLDCLRSF